MAFTPAVAVPRFPLYESVLAPGERKSAKSAMLAHLAETPRLARVTAASHLEIRPAPATVSSGVAPIDALTGGLPRGCLTEITGLASSGRTSVLLAALAAATRRSEICALIDAADAFDPTSGAAAGIDFDRLLWVRCTGTATKNDKAKSLAKVTTQPAETAPDSRTIQRSSSNASSAPSSRATRREPRPSHQLRESRDGYGTAPTHRASADAQGVRNYFQSAPVSRAPVATAQADLFLSAKSHPLLENTPAEDPLTVWKRRLMEDPVEQALRAADLLLQSGGFGMIAIDLGGIPAKTARRIPLATWFRFRRVIEPTPTVMLLIDECSCAQTCASLSLQMGAQKRLLMNGPTEEEGTSLVDGRWSLANESLTTEDSQFEAYGLQPTDHNSQHIAQSSKLKAHTSQLNDPNIQPVAQISQPTSSESLQRHQKSAPHFNAGSAPSLIAESALADDTTSHCRLLDGLSLRAELLRARTERKPMQSVTNFVSKTAWMG